VPRPPADDPTAATTSSPPTASDESEARAADAGLVAALVAGDRNALALLYDRHAGVLLALAVRLLRDRAQAEELLHDVFLEAWHHARDFDPSRGSVRAWLVTRTRSRAFDRRAALARHGRLSEEAALEQQDHTAAASADAGLPLDAARVRQEVTRLPPELVTVLELAYFEGLSFSEIGEALRIPLGTVKSRMARALSALREGMGLPSAPGPKEAPR
jgi:RNA polymerase sigma-70 factor (ECF subfamily)